MERQAKDCSYQGILNSQGQDVRDNLLRSAQMVGYKRLNTRVTQTLHVIDDDIPLGKDVPERYMPYCIGSASFELRSRWLCTVATKTILLTPKMFLHFPQAPLARRFLDWFR